MTDTATTEPSQRRFAGNPSFVPSRNTAILYRALLAVPIGGEVTYHELSRLVGWDPVTGSYPPLISARKKAQSQDHAVFDIIKRHGLRRLTPSEVVDKSIQRRKGLRALASRGLRELETLDKNGSNAPLSPSHENKRRVQGVVYKEVIRTVKEATFDGAEVVAAAAKTNQADVDQVVRQFLRSGKRVKLVEETVSTTVVCENEEPVTTSETIFSHEECSEKDE
jgi:hypothetical protein